MVALSTNPLDRSIVYVVSALGTALLAYVAIDWLAERFPAATDPLRRAGQLTLSLYLLHIVVFNLVVDWLEWVRPAGTSTALLFAAGVLDRGDRPGHMVATPIRTRTRRIPLPGVRRLTRRNSPFGADGLDGVLAIRPHPPRRVGPAHRVATE